MIRRKKKKASLSAEAGTETDSTVGTGQNENPAESVGGEGTHEPESAEAIELDRSAGPYDVAEADDLDERIDLGGLRIQKLDELQVRVDIDPRTQQPAGVTLISGQGAVQIRPYSSPRSGGTWEEIRADITAEILGGEGQVEEFVGEFGMELQARVKVQDQDGDTTTQTIRFVGVEGPRWMLQGIFFGEGADPLTAGRLNTVFRSVVVVRGDGPMPAKEPLKITVPESDPTPGTQADNTLPDEEGYQPPVAGVEYDDDVLRDSGPYDVAEVEEDPDWLDLGSLRIPFDDDLEINIEVDEDTDEAMAVTLVYGEGAVQVRPFSALGLSATWEDARAEIKAGISSDGGLVDEVPGVFGAELRAQVSTEDEDGKPYIQPIRFVGVNGPGWMLQGIFLGEGTDPESAMDLEAIFRSVVVDSTVQEVPAGDPLPLTEPRDLPDDVVVIEDDDGGQQG